MKLFSSYCSKTGVLHVAAFKYFCTRSVKQYCTKMAMNLSQDIQFLSCISTAVLTCNIDIAVVSACLSICMSVSVTFQYCIETS